MTIGAGSIGSLSIGAPAGSEEFTGPIVLALRLEIAPPTPIELPVRLEIAAVAAVSLTLRLQVSEAGAALALPLSLGVISDAVLGGLGGAGGWPSAPGGSWRHVVTLDGVDISNQVTGQIVVQHADNEARTAEFSFRPSAVIQPMSLIGRRVQIAFAQRDAADAPVNAQVIFTGILELPSINLGSGVILCSCHDQMQEVFANTPTAWVDANVGGRWRVEVSGEPADGWDYLEARKLSVPVSVALDAQQLARVLPWRGGLTAETVQLEDILDDSLSVDLPSRDELRTRITCRMQYRYTRLRGRGAVAGYAQTLGFFIATASQKLWLTTAMVKGSAEGLRGWTLESLTIENPTPATYPRGPGLDDGVYVITRAVAPDLALGFQAKYSTRWQQTITEDYTLELVLPDVEALIGRVSEEIGATLDVEFDVKDWDSDETVAPILATPTAGDVIEDWKPTGQAEADRDEIMRVLLDQAWVKLWAASRSGRVRFALPLRPNLWLDNEYTIDTPRLTARGKVVEIEHRMDTETGEAITSASIAVGLPGDTAASMPTWTLPAPAALDDARPPSAYSFEIGTFVGGEGASPPFDEETMIGFSTNLELPPSFAENFYPHQLSIKAPDVESRDRDPLTLETVATISTTIPTDLLELT